MIPFGPGARVRIERMPVGPPPVSINTGTILRAFRANDPTTGLDRDTETWLVELDLWQVERVVPQQDLTLLRV